MEGIPGGNTAEGQAALLSLHHWHIQHRRWLFLSLEESTLKASSTRPWALARSLPTWETQVQALEVENTATGAAALLNNTTG